MKIPLIVQNAWIHAYMLLVKHGGWKRFIKQTSHPQAVQQAVLQRILTSQAQTAFGEKHRFKVLRGYHEFRLGVPIHTYEDLRPFIEAQEQIKDAQLNMEAPVRYALTSGTTGKPKYIPILGSTEEAIRGYQQLSTYAQYRALPAIFRGKMLVIAGQAHEGYLETGTSYGSMSGLLSAGLPQVLKQKLLLPESLNLIGDYQRKYFRMAAWALAEPALSVIATANPSTLLKLLDMGRQHFPKILELLSSKDQNMHQKDGPIPRPTRRRLRYLQSFLGHENRLTMEELWPKLQAVVTWTGGSCGVLIPRLKTVLPKKTKIVEMGYLASECLGSLNVDVENNRCIPTFHENFFEFIEQAEWDRNHPTTLTLDQIEKGKKYYVVVTTSNGLYRYFINDLIEVTGRFNKVPTIRFVQKGKGVTNLTGEKLCEYHIMEAMEEIQKGYHTTIDFYLMVGNARTLQYTLYIEHPPLDYFVGYKLERHLGQGNPEFHAKRESTRLGPTQIVYLQPGTAEAYKVHCVQQGQREAQFKLVKLQYAQDCSFDFAKYVRS